MRGSVPPTELHEAARKSDKGPQAAGLTVHCYCSTLVALLNWQPSTALHTATSHLHLTLV